MNTIQNIDPASLLVDHNIRTDLDLTEPFIESIRTHGVLQPVVVVEADDGLRVRMGHRRTAAAIQAGLASIPAVVLAADDDEAHRIITQHAENEHRSGLRRRDTVAAVQQLAALGLSVKDISDQTQIDKSTVTAAKTVAAATNASQAALDTLPALTIEQAAILAEFDNTPTIQERIIRTIEQRGQTRGEIDHILAGALNERDMPVAQEQAAAARAAEGITVIDPPGYEDKSVLEAQRIKGRPSRDEHEACPGHVEYVSRYRSDGHPITETVNGRQYDVGLAWGCKNWRKHGHTDAWASGYNSRPTDGMDREAAKAHRRKVITLNKAGEAAKTVRVDWLKSFTLRKKPSPGAAAWSLAAHLDSRGDLAYDTSRQMCDVLGLAWTTDNGPRQMLRTWISDQPAARQTHALACFHLWENEARTTRELWRSSSSEDYLTQLAEWGYDLSPVEQIAAGTKTEDEAMTDLDAATASDSEPDQ